MVFNIDFEPLSFVYKPEDNIKVPVHDITISRTESIISQKDKILVQLLDAGCVLHAKDSAEASSLNEYSNLDHISSNSTDSDTHKTSKKARGNVDCVICCAGSSSNPGITIHDAMIFDSLYNHLSCNLEPALLASHISALFGAPGSLLVLTGAASCQMHNSSTPHTLAYGISKSATHFTARSVANDSLMKERGITTLCVTPHVIDTPHNRLIYPEADVTAWTLPEEIANIIVHWLEPDASVAGVTSVASLAMDVDESMQEAGLGLGIGVEVGVGTEIGLGLGLGLGEVLELASESGGVKMQVIQKDDAKHKETVIVNSKSKGKGKGKGKSKGNVHQSIHHNHATSPSHEQTINEISLSSSSSSLSSSSSSSVDDEEEGKPLQMNHLIQRPASGSFVSVSGSARSNTLKIEIS